MLTLHKHKKQLKYTGIILLVIVVIGGGIFAYQQISRSHAQTPYTNPINYDAPSQEEKQAGEDTKIDQIEHNNQTSTPQPGANEKVTITNFTQDSATKKVTVQTELTGGAYQTCTLTLSSGSEVITKTAEVIYQNSFSTCMGFTISASDFPTGGVWTAKLTISKPDGGTTSSATLQTAITK